MVYFVWTFRVQAFVRTFMVEDLYELGEARLLLKKVRGCGFGGFFFQNEMHAFRMTVLLRMTRLDAFDASAQA